MKILMLTPYLPHPPSSGGQIRSYNLIKHLSKKHEITLFSLIKKPAEKKHISHLSKFCKKVEVFRRSASPWTLRNILLTGFGSYPFLVIRNLSSTEKKAVEMELREQKYDLIHAETFYVMPHIPETNIPVLLVDQTIEYSVYKHYVDTQAKFWLQPLLWIDLIKLKYWEKKYWQKADKVLAVSLTDKKAMMKLSPGLDVNIVPNGVNLDFFNVKKNWTSSNPKILFVANFKWLQNVEAAHLLIDKVFPLIKRQIPTASLNIVGQFIPDSLIQKSGASVFVTNLDPNDEESIKQAYLEASLFVSPLRGPGGTRLKHFAAMATKVPLVTTKVGAEGLGEDGVNVVIRETPRDIAAESVKILKNPDFARQLAENARKLVEQKYSWEIIAKGLDKIYEETKRKN